MRNDAAILFDMVNKSKMFFYIRSMHYHLPLLLLSSSKFGKLLYIRRYDFKSILVLCKLRELFEAICVEFIGDPPICNTLLWVLPSLLYFERFYAFFANRWPALDHVFFYSIVLPESLMHYSKKMISPKTYYSLKIDRGQ